METSGIINLIGVLELANGRILGSAKRKTNSVVVKAPGDCDEHCNAINKMEIGAKSHMFEFFEEGSRDLNSI